MLKASSLLNYSISKIHQQLVSGKITPVELFEVCHQRIQETKILNGFITETDQFGRQQAENSYKRYLNGK